MTHTPSFPRIARRPAARKPSPRYRPLLEALEDRSLLSGSPPTVLISGPPQVGESPYGPYTLNLTAVDPENDPVTQWTINWGDGSVETLTGNPSIATHDYTNGPVVRNITASAVVDGQTFAAHVSGGGAFLGTFAEGNGHQGVVYYVTVGPDDTDDGVADFYVGGVTSDDVAVYDGATGGYVRHLITAADGLDNPRAVIIGPDGNLYVSGRSSNNVLRYDFDTGTVSQYIPASSGISEPQGLAFDSDGNLYIVQESPSPNPDYIIPQILRRDHITGQLSLFINLQDQNILFSPALEFRNGYLYLLAWSSQSDSNMAIVRYDATTGAFHDIFIPPPAEGGATYGFAFGPDGDLYVAYSGAQSNVARYDGTTGAYLGKVSAGLSGDGAYEVEFGPDANGDGQPDMYVSNGGTNSILHYAGPFTTTAATSLAVTVLDSTTKFYVVNDGASDLTYEYAAAGFGVNSYGLNAGNTAPRGAASNAAGNRVWVVDASKKVFIYNAAGTLLGSWTLGGLTGTAQVEDIATNGTDIWVVDAKQDKVYRYTGAASRLSGSQNAASSFSLNSGNKNPKGMVTDGTSLWVVDDAAPDKVFKYTLTGSLLGSWALNSGGGSPRGITLDPSNPQHLWIVDNGSNRVYQYDNAVTRTSGSQAASMSFALAAGNTNPQGIADPPAGLTAGWEPAPRPAPRPGAGQDELRARQESPRVGERLAALDLALTDWTGLAAELAALERRSSRR